MGLANITTHDEVDKLVEKIANAEEKLKIIKVRQWQLCPGKAAAKRKFKVYPSAMLICGLVNIAKAK